NDYLAGGDGNDTYFTDGGDSIFELSTGGNDTISSSVSYTLGSYLDNLVLTGTALNGTGNDDANLIAGNASRNVLDGGAGADTLIGGKGNDTYLVNDSNDVIVEDSIAGSGTDLVQSTASSYTLSDNVENLTLTGSGNINGTGNLGANKITGNAGNNAIDGGE